MDDCNSEQPILSSAKSYFQFHRPYGWKYKEFPPILPSLFHHRAHKNIDHADNAVDGLDMIEAAITEGKPYDLIVSDMYFPMSKGGMEVQAGMYVIEELSARGIDVPIIVCSSARMVIPDIVGCIHYNPYRNDLDADMRELIELIGSM